MSRENKLLFALILWVFCAAGSRSYAKESIESDILKVEVVSEPFSFIVTNRKSNEVLLTHTSTHLGLDSVTGAVMVRSDGSGFTWTLQTAARKNAASLTISFPKSNVARISLTSTIAPGESIAQEFLDRGEHYYGVWEYPYSGGLDNRGVEEHFMSVGNMPSGSFASARAPFYVTSANYGVYVETSAPGFYRFALNGRTLFSFTSSQLTYDIIQGNSMKDVLSHYNMLAGPALLPPTWAFDSFWWRDNAHQDLRNASNAQEKIIDDAAQLQKNKIHASAIWIDRPYGTGTLGWGNMDFDASFPDPRGLVDSLNARGMRTLLWIANRCGNQLFTEAETQKFLFGGMGSGADIRNPLAYKWFKQKLQPFSQLGISGYKIDRGEEGELPEGVQNEVVSLFSKLAIQSLQEAGVRDGFIFTRNLNDTGRRYSAVYNGDVSSDFAGLQLSVKNALRCSMMNFPIWGSDTGGYRGIPNKELMARWLAFSAYCPFMEVLIGPERTLWNDYDAELLEIARKFTAEHHDLIPYMRNCARQASKTGVPIMRPLTLEFPDDAPLADVYDRYLLGDALLVAPVLRSGTTTDTIPIPSGRWLEYNSRQGVYEGPGNITVKVSLDKIPLFVREGAIIPRGDVLKSNNCWTPEWSPQLRIEMFPGREISTLKYYLEEKEVPIVCTPVDEGFSLTVPDLEIPVTLEIFCSEPARVRSGTTVLQRPVDYDYSRERLCLVIRLNGAKQLILDGCQSLFQLKQP